MTTQARRLDRVEGLLTPKQAALLWLQEARQHPDSGTYSRSLKGQPISAFPLSVMERQVEESVRSSIKGEKREAIDQTVWQAQRDCIFLFKVAIVANRAWDEHERAFDMARLALVFILGRLLEHKTEVLKPKADKHDLAEFLEHARLFVRVMDSTLGEALVLQRALAALGARYFDGERVLFPQAAADLDDLVLRLGEIGELYNDAVGEPLAARKHAGLVARTVADWEPKVTEAVEQAAAYLVDRAKAEALLVCGEVNAAADVMSRHV